MKELEFMGLCSTEVCEALKDFERLLIPVDGDWIYEIVDDHLYVKNPLYGCLDKCVDTTTLEWRMLRHLPEAKYSATFREGGDALFFAQSRDENETWLPLLEKAYAKVHGDYWSIDGGFTGEAIEDLTGGITTELRIEDILVSCDE